MIDKYGLSWIKISEEMGMNDPMKIKNRYYSQIKKKDMFEELLEEGKEIYENEEAEKTAQAHQTENDSSTPVKKTQEAELTPQSQIESPLTTNCNSSALESQERETSIYHGSDSGSNAEEDHEKSSQETGPLVNRLACLEASLERFGEDFFEIGTELNTNITDNAF
mmetsp:Transcript_3508/g.3059  ORF Transcript_3508/g.3059 Transcript_3508/m.3059 type:complete len:166 (-) Transcript_3508:328-825(-)